MACNEATFVPLKAGRRWVEARNLPAWFRASATVAAAAAAATTESTTATAAAAAEAARPFGLRTCFVDGEAASAELMRVELRDRFLRLFVGAHLNKREPTSLARGAVAHHRNALDCADAGKQILQFRFFGLERQIPDV